MNDNKWLFDVKCTVKIEDQQGVMKQIVGKNFKLDYKSDCFKCSSGDTIHIILSEQYNQELFDSANYVMAGIEVENLPNNTKCISFGGLLGRFDSLKNTPILHECAYLYITHLKNASKNKKVKK
jgi:hypothetical protein